MKSLINNYCWLIFAIHWVC